MHEPDHDTQEHSGREVLRLLDEEIGRQSRAREAITREKLAPAALGILVLAVIVNIAGYASMGRSFLLVWISASLYFYLFYPLLPLFAFPFRYLLKGRKGKIRDGNQDSVLEWAKRAHIFRNKRVGFRLFMRFFILSLLPLTIGMFCIYLVSIAFSLVLGYTGTLPIETMQLILVQCLGIILFYIEIFFFRTHLFNFTGYVRRQSGKKKRNLVIIAVLGVACILVGTVVGLLLLVAILLPGFTLTHYINVSEFYQVRTNIWVLIVLLSQMVIMQFLQNVLSIRIAQDLCDTLLARLGAARSVWGGQASVPGGRAQDQGDGAASQPVHNALTLLRESALYAINRRQMFGLFPTYSIGINLGTLLSLTDLGDLNDVFPKKSRDEA